VRLWTFIAPALCAAAALLMSEARAQVMRPADGAYSEAQAARGKASYGQACARCHGAELLGSYDTPSLRGRLIRHWSGTTLDGLADYLNRAMPIHTPGALSPAINADILAYILKANGYPAGAKDLESDPAALKTIRLTAPAGVLPR
jgi:mono/diheme cytochrome c family protein